MKAKLTYRPNGGTINTLFFKLPPNESNPELAKSKDTSENRNNVPAVVNTFNFFSSFISEIGLPDISLLRAVIALGLITYQGIKDFSQLSPTIIFKQKEYKSPEKIALLFKEIKQENPQYFYKWLKAASFETEEKALSFVIDSIMDGFCEGIIMTLIKKGAHNDFGKIKSALTEMKINPSKAIKRQILLLMAHTASLSDVPMENKVGFFIPAMCEEKTKEQVANELISYVYGKSGPVFCIANAPSISLLQDRKHFLKQLIMLITTSHYLPLSETSEPFLSHNSTFEDLLHARGVWEEEDVNKYTEEVEEANFFLIRLIISTKTKAHAVGIFINKTNFLFVDPNHGLYDCKDLYDLADKTYFIMNTAYPSYDLNNVSLLIHMPMPHCLKTLDLKI